MILEEHKSRLQKYQYVSFDLFDTLIFRTVSSPNRIYDLVEELYKTETHYPINKFSKRRMEAEWNARATMHGKEVDIEYIYSFLPYSEKKKKKLLKFEKQCEIDNCTPNKRMVELANWCYEQKKKVIVTTDMYLDRFTISAILNEIGVKYHRLFISSEEGVTKRSGLLFKRVIEKMGIQSNDLIHIGDDIHNDIKMAAAQNIESFYRICNDVKDGFYIKNSHKNIAEDHLLSIMRNSSRDIEDNMSSFRIGYSVIGPLMYDFCQWIHYIKLKYRLEKLFFVAREGFLCKKCYETLYPEEIDCIDYIYLNKNLLRLPMLNSDNKRKTFIESIPMFDSLTWDDIFDLLLVGNKRSVCQELVDKFPQISFKDPIKRDNLNSGTYDDIIDYILNLQENVISNQEELLKVYLKDKGLWTSKVGIVNNSINGSGQYGIESFIRKNGGTPTLLGIQFIVSSVCKMRLQNRCCSYLEDKGISGFLQSEFQRFCLVFEHLLFEPAATAKCFAEHMGKIIVKHLEIGKETQNLNIVKKIQDYTVKFVQDYMNSVPLSLNTIPIYIYFNLMHNPFFEDAKLIGALYDKDIYGTNRLVPNIPYKWQYDMAVGLPQSVQWIEGFLRVHGRPFTKLIKYRMYETYIRHKIFFHKK